MGKGPPMFSFCEGDMTERMHPLDDLDGEVTVDTMSTADPFPHAYVRVRARHSSGVVGEADGKNTGVVAVRKRAMDELLKNLEEAGGC